MNATGMRPELARRLMDGTPWRTAAAVPAPLFEGRPGPRRLPAAPRQSLMGNPLVSDKLWGLVAPLLPSRPRRVRYPDRRPLGDRKALTGILFVLKAGIPWEHLPCEMGCGS